MEPYETLEYARDCKERGNDSFRRKLWFEAQSFYTEILAALTDEIAFTADDQRKERDRLLLSAHLNMAQCGLRREETALALYHCNMALDMDSKNVKGHYRKAKAFEDRSEFVKAVESYRRVLELDPECKEARTQLDECQKKVDSQKAEEQLSNEYEDLAVEDEDVEVAYEEYDSDDSRN